MAGWASNNKWSLIGGIRSAAQIVSYEIPAGLSIFPIVLITGTLSMQGIIQAQGWAPWDWFIFTTRSPSSPSSSSSPRRSPRATARRSTCRRPSRSWSPASSPSTRGVRYLIFFLAEWGNLYVIGAVLTTLFLGGWQVPPVTDNAVLRTVLAVPHLLRQVVLLGDPGRHVDPRHPAAHPRRPAHVDLLEVPGADRVRERARHGACGW